MYGTFTYIWLIFLANLGKYTSPMDPMDSLTKTFHPASVVARHIVLQDRYQVHRRRPRGLVRF